MPLPLPKATLVIRNAFVATCDRGPSDPGLIPAGAVAVADRQIAWVGPERDLGVARVDVEGATVLDARGGLVTPGLVDSHTHLLFGGERANEFAMRCAGASYEELARAGGGIAATTRATAAASDEALLAGAVARARRLLAQGITTVEVKSGYGLSLDSELRLLRLVDALAHALWREQTVVPTLLAHAVPPERAGDRVAYVREIAERWIPAVASERLARCCDVFAEEGAGAFGIGEARRILLAGRAAGLVPRLHADQLASSGSGGGGARLAAEVGAASADHLEELDEAGIAALAEAGVVAGLLPVATLVLRKARYAPGRKLVDAGVRVSLATNLNPGSAMSENAALTLGLACLQLGLTPAEALVAFTDGGARALRRDDLGRLAPGLEADLVVWGSPSLEHLAWHLGVSHALTVVKRGRVVHQAPEGAAADCR
jgi:imidazolonepropionase